MTPSTIKLHHCPKISNVDFAQRVSDNQLATGQVDGPELETVRGFAFEEPQISFRIACSILLNVTSCPSTSSVSNNGGAFFRPQVATRMG
jgi:hypothetical protein